jgi:hypothetical protein
MKKIIQIGLGLLLISINCDAGRVLLQSATAVIQVGPFLNDTSGGPEFGLDPTTLKCRIAKGDVISSTLTITSSGGDNDMVDVGWGMYSLELSNTDTETLGNLMVWFYKEGVMSVWESFEVLPANVFASRRGTDYLDVNIFQVAESEVLGVLSGEEFADMVWEATPTQAESTGTKLFNNSTYAQVNAEIAQATSTIATEIQGLNDISTGDVTSIVSSSQNTSSGRS